MQTLEKRSSESVLYDIDLSMLLATTETVSSVTAIVAEPTGALVFGSPNINGSTQTYTDAYGTTRTAAPGKVVQVQISGGTIPTGAQVQDYVIRCKVVTNLNPLVEGTVRLRVNDTP